MKRPGRRPGKQDTSAAILAAAREVFAERGFDRASIRAIATAADVDPALVHHYFGTKHDLFLAVIRPPIDPRTLVPRLLAGELRPGPGGVGEHFVRTFVGLLENPEAGAAVRSLIRSAITDETSARLVKEFFHTQVAREVQEQVHGKVPSAEVPWRASLIASQLIGLMTARYLIEVEPLATATLDELVAALGPTVDRYLLGDLGSNASAPNPSGESTPGSDEPAG